MLYTKKPTRKQLPAGPPTRSPSFLLLLLYGRRRMSGTRKNIKRDINISWSLHRQLYFHIHLSSFFEFEMVRLPSLLPHARCLSRVNFRLDYTELPIGWPAQLCAARRYIVCVDAQHHGILVHTIRWLSLLHTTFTRYWSASTKVAFIFPLSETTRLFFYNTRRILQSKG